MWSYERQCHSHSLWITSTEPQDRRTVEDIKFSLGRIVPLYHHPLSGGGHTAIRGTRKHWTVSALHPLMLLVISGISLRVSLSIVYWYLSISVVLAKCKVGKGQPTVLPPEGSMGPCTQVSPCHHEPPWESRQTYLPLRKNSPGVKNPCCWSKPGKRMFLLAMVPRRAWECHCWKQWQTLNASAAYTVQTTDSFCFNL